jgi:hypothetical protein
MDMDLTKSVEESIDTPPLSTIFGELDVDGSQLANARFFRKDGMLYVRIDGKERQVTHEYIEKIYRASEKCATSGFEDAHGKSCSEYLKDCLQGNGIESCKDFLTKPEFWRNAIKEVKNMLPQIAYKTLESFGFKIKDDFDPIMKQTLRKFETVDEWLSKLKIIAESKTDPTLDEDEFKAIRDNDRLLGYLRLVTEKFRLNPGLLNENFKGEFNPNVIPAVHYDQLDQSGVPSYSEVRSNYDVVNQVGKLRNLLTLTGGANHVTLAKYPWMGSQFESGVGGTPISIDILLSQINAGKKQSWSILRQNYEILKKELNNRGKDIAPNDKEKLESILESIKRNELFMAKIIFMLEKYINSTRPSGLGDPIDDKLLQLDVIQKYIEQQKKTSINISAKQELMLKALESLSSVVKNLY